MNALAGQWCFRGRKLAGPDFELERQALRQGAGSVGGVDEAGRGPWAGPVVAAAVILDPQAIPEGLDDSKKLTRRRREQLFEELLAAATIGIGVGDVSRIDRDNIRNATLWAMAEAVTAMGAPCGAVLVDGNVCPQLACPAKAVIGGDRKSLSIAAASIVAKVTRDRIMHDLDREFPAYGWAHNKGYGTKAHRSAIERVGVCRHHRRSYRPIREALARSPGGAVGGAPK